MTNEQFLNTELTITDTEIYYIESGSKEIVMSDLEYEIMDRVTDILYGDDKNILEIGFGMGISANLFQQKGVKSHTIIEAHPQIIEKANIWADGKENVTILEGNYINFLVNNELDRYDSIFFDIYSIDNDDFIKFLWSLRGSAKINSICNRPCKIGIFNVSIVDISNVDMYGLMEKYDSYEMEILEFQVYVPDDRKWYLDNKKFYMPIYTLFK